MSPKPRQASEATAKFHRVVSDGALEDLRAALHGGAEIDAPGHVGMTALMCAMHARDLEKVKLLIQLGADPELSDDFNETALRHAVLADFVDGVRYLIRLGVDRGFHPRQPPLSAGLQEVVSDADWKVSWETTCDSIRELGDRPPLEPVISSARSVAVLKAFLEAGDDLNLAPTEVKREFVGLQTGSELQTDENAYRRHKSPRYGVRNPEAMNFPFWRDMIRTGVNAYSARSRFNDDNPYDNPGAVWCFDRFGSSWTQLGDGRCVQIGGEHEDFYDPDFHIYNDVVIHDGRGDFQIYGYPSDVFPPTDFHTATLCPDGIYIIGCLGYGEQRRIGCTPVYRLRLDSWSIDPVDTRGDSPGWIHKHFAAYQPEQGLISITGGTIYEQHANGKSRLARNDQRYTLDLTRLVWGRVEQ